MRSTSHATPATVCSGIGANMNFRALRPIKTRTCNLVLTAPEGSKDVTDLHACRFINEVGVPSIVTFWKVDSVADRAAFLETGVIALYTLGTTQPPVSVLMAPPHEDYKEIKS